MRMSVVPGASVDNVDIEDLIPQQSVAIMMTNGLIKRMPIANFKGNTRWTRSKWYVDS